MANPIPSLAAQFNGYVEADTLTIHMFREPDFPYGRKPNYDYLAAFTSAADAIIEFHNIWMRFMEDNDGSV